MRGPFAYFGSPASLLNGIMNDFGQESTLKSSCTLPFTVFDLLVDMLVKLVLNEFWLRLCKMLSIWLRLYKNRVPSFSIFFGFGYVL
mmetsp:Transcript_6773/g.8834  ORF Transcript_6773/g.8834 Transcript_6773/m.8834 type:complete len:87 (-) Transcript_6773:135-395(-)